MAVKPTPTQAENDAAATGNTPLEKEHDGSDVEVQLTAETRAAQPAPEPRGTYRTRRVEPA